MDKQIAPYPYNGTLSNNTKEQTTDMQHGESQMLLLTERC